MTSLVVLFSYQINRNSRKEITQQLLYERSYIMKRNNLQQLYERSYIMILTDLPNAIKKLREKISFHERYKVESFHVFSSFAHDVLLCHWAPSWLITQLI